MKKYKIIIVENDEDEQFFLKEGFDTADLFEIMAQVNNGDELLEWLSNNESNLPEIILSDLNMPGKNGYDIISEVKGTPAFAHIPVIITSTSSTKTIIKKCLDLGAADYVVKPDTFIQYAPFVKELYKRVQEKQPVKE